MLAERCWLFVVCCSLYCSRCFVMCELLVVGCCFGVDCLLVVGCCLLCVGSCLLFSVWLLLVVCNLLVVGCCVFCDVRDCLKNNRFVVFAWCCALFVICRDW